jgi:predicted DNA-binding transcriptional regulator AlpA
MPLSSGANRKTTVTQLTAAQTVKFGQRTGHIGSSASPPFDTLVESKNLNPKAAQEVRLKPIDWVCEILSLKKSAVHAKVAEGTLPEPIKFGTSRRAASRWLEHEIYDCVWRLAEQRPPQSPLPPTTVPATSAVEELVHPEVLTKTVATTKKTRQAYSLPASAGGTP